MRLAGMVHTRAFVSISSHVAPRTSPERTAVSTRNSKASLTAADAGEGEAFQAAQPGLGVCGVAPAGPLLLHHGASGFGEGGHALGAAPLGQRVAARAGELAIGERLLAGFGERDQAGAAETEFAAASPDDEALDPAAGSGRLDIEVEVQAVAVCVRSRRSGGDEGGGSWTIGHLRRRRAGTGDHTAPVTGKRSGSRPCRHATSGIAVTPPGQSFPRRFT